MTEPEAVEQVLGPVERELLAVAMAGLQVVLHAQVLLVLGADERGVFCWPRPGAESEVADELLRLDWRGLARKLKATT
jgi:hypothetical protein